MKSTQVSCHRVTLSVLILATVTSVAAAGEADDLISRSDTSLKSDTEVITYDMEIVSGGGEVEQTRQLVTYSKRNRDGERTLQKFQSPPVFDGTGLLVADTDGDRNDIWFYEPSSRRVRRIAGQEESNQYMGTEYSYEDFEGYQISQYDFTLLQSKNCKDSDTKCQLVEAKPSTDEEREASGYAKKVYWIQDKSLYPVRVDLYDYSGEIVKVSTAYGLHKVGNYWRPERQEMTNLRSGRTTRLELVEIEIDEPLEDFYVSKRFLRR